jgi:hypothetical protein
MLVLDHALGLLNTGAQKAKAWQTRVEKKRKAIRRRLTVGTTTTLVADGGGDVTLIAGRLRDLWQQRVSHSAGFVCLQ